MAHGLFFLRFTPADDRDLAAGADDKLAHRFGEVQAFLVDQARNHREQRTIGVLQAEQLAYMGGVDRLAIPVADAEGLDQVVVGGRIPLTVVMWLE